MSADVAPERLKVLLKAAVAPGKVMAVKDKKQLGEAIRCTMTLFFFPPTYTYFDLPQFLQNAKQRT